MQDAGLFLVNIDRYRSISRVIANGTVHHYRVQGPSPNRIPPPTPPRVSIPGGIRCVLLPNQHLLVADEHRGALPCFSHFNLTHIRTSLASYSSLRLSA